MDEAVERGPAPVRDDLRPYVISGLTAVALIVGGFGGWAAIASLSGAVVAPGTVVVDSNVKKVQHASGGIVGEIRVRDGDRISAGDLLMRLDDTITRVNLQIITGQLDELAVRKSRLDAERDGADKLPVPDSLARRMNEPTAAEIVASERSLFESRRAARAGRKAQLAERIAQLRKEIDGIEAQERAKSEEIDLIAKELVALLELQRKSLVPSLKVTSLQRESTRLGGERAQLIATSAQALGKIAEIELQLIQVDQDLKSEVMKDLREVQAKQADLSERRVAAEDQLRRTDIRASHSGVVHQLAVHTVGGVINQSEPVMLIVPDGEALVIEARIAPQDIEQVRAGQPTVIRFTAFNQRTTPEVPGEVQRVSADLTREAQTGLSYFVARILLAEGEKQKLGGAALVPGMPAEVFIRTNERTALSYFMKPLSDQIARAFRER